MLDRCVVRSDNPKYPQNEYMYLEVNLDYSFVEYHQQMRCHDLVPFFPDFSYLLSKPVYLTVSPSNG